MLKPSLQLRIGQQLTMTPQLQQAIRLLQLPVIELQQQIQEALESNVMLDTVEDEVIDTQVAESERREPEPEPTVRSDDSQHDDSQRDDSQHTESMVEENWDRPMSTAADPSWNSSEPRLTQDFADTSGESLQDHLIWQLELEDFSPREIAIGQGIVDAINDDGYLIDSLETIQTTLAAAGEVSIEELEKVLEKVQKLDPAGVGARGISECLDLQLRQLDPATPGLALARALVQDHLELVAEHQYPALRRLLQVSEDELEQAIALVRSLHPRPGSVIQSGEAQYVVPDVFVRKHDGRWQVDINTSITPNLRVNQNYANQLTRGGDHSILRTQLQEARWLIRSLEIRGETLMKVATCIVERQQEFMEHGDEAMVPMVLRDVAETLDMHESTISRVTTNKYMHTPRGVFEFRHFFSSHVGTADGNELSSVAIRAKIRKLIAKENPAKPLSDSKIAKTLVDRGINVARRTVAKYREAMSIPSSSERKKLNIR